MGHSGIYSPPEAIWDELPHSVLATVWFFSPQSPILFRMYVNLVNFRKLCVYLSGFQTILSVITIISGTISHPAKFVIVRGLCNQKFKAAWQIRGYICCLTPRNFWVQSPIKPGVFLCEVWMFSPCLRGCSSGTGLTPTVKNVHVRLPSAK